jgi:trigger factor
VEEALKVEVSNLNSCRRELRIEVPADKVREEMDRAAERLARSVRLPGFRPGKAPLSLVRSRYGKAIEEEAVEHLLSQCTRLAIDEQGLQPLHAPHLSSMDFRPGEPLSFRTVFEVRPAVEPRGYDKLKVSVDPEPVTDAQVDERLESIRQTAARLAPIEGRAARAGDILLADVRWWRGAREGKPTERPGVHLELGSDAQHPEFSRALEGAEPGQVRDFEIEYPADYRAAELAAARIFYRVKVRALRERQVPALDDALAREVGEFADLAALRVEVRRRAEAEEKEKARAESVRRALDALLEANPIDVPEIMVEAQIDDQLEDVARALAAQGVALERAQVDWKAERERWREAARRSVAARLLLEAIAERESIEVSAQALEERLQREAQRARQPLAAVRSRLEKSGAIAALERQLRRERVLDFLLTGVKIERVAEDQ